MSTEQRYGDAVWAALVEISYLVHPTMYVMVTVGEVAEKAEVSKPTAKKYLDMLANAGHIVACKMGKHTFYRMIFNVENY